MHPLTDLKNTKKSKSRHIITNNNDNTLGWLISTVDKSASYFNEDKFEQLADTYYKDIDKFMILTLLDKSNKDIKDSSELPDIIYVIYGIMFIIVLRSFSQFGPIIFSETGILILGAIGSLIVKIHSTLNGSVTTAIIDLNIPKSKLNHTVLKNLQLPGKRHILIQEFTQLNLSENDRCGLLYIYSDGTVNGCYLHDVYSTIEFDYRHNLYVFDVEETQRLNIPVIRGNMYTGKRTTLHKLTKNDIYKIKKYCGITEENNEYEVIHQIKYVIYWYKKDGNVKVLQICIQD